MVLLTEDIEEFSACLRRLRQEMVDVSFSGNINSAWYARTRSEFIEAGGSWREIEWMFDCLRKNVPKMRSYLSKHLGNGGIESSDNVMIGMRVNFHTGGFSDSDFERAVDQAVNEFFAAKRQKFAAIRCW